MFADEIFLLRSSKQITMVKQRNRYKTLHTDREY